MGSAYVYLVDLRSGAAKWNYPPVIQIRVCGQDDKATNATNERDGRKKDHEIRVDP